MKKTTTERGFPVGSFKDFYNEDCSIQISSIAGPRCIWFGIDKVNPIVMASQAESVGVKTDKTTGWVEYLIPEEVLLHSRMHLSQEQVKELLPTLIKFAETGEI